MENLSRWVKNNHNLVMVICCVVPMALLAAVFVFNIPIGTIGTFLLFLLCPLMHVFMMRGMGHGSHQTGHHVGTVPVAQAIKNGEVESHPGNNKTAE